MAQYVVFFFSFFIASHINASETSEGRGYAEGPRARDFAREFYGRPMFPLLSKSYGRGQLTIDGPIPTDTKIEMQKAFEDTYRAASPAQLSKPNEWIKTVDGKRIVVRWNPGVKVTSGHGSGR